MRIYESTRVFGDISDSERPIRVNIVGAGLAGLACGAQLAEQGHRVSIFEARSRIGGRVDTQRNAFGGVLFERGAKFIAGRHTWWHALAQENKLQLVAAQPSPDLPFIEDGCTLSHERTACLREETDQALAKLTDMASHLDLEKPWESNDAVSLDSASVASWALRIQPDRIKRAALVGYLEGLNAVAVGKQSLLGHLVQVKADGRGNADEDSLGFRCENGNDSLAQALKNKITVNGVSVHLSTKVSRIDPDTGSIWLEGGQEHGADAVTLAVPPSTWDAFVLDGGWPHLSRPQMGLATKVAVTFSGAQNLEPLGDHHSRRGGVVWESWTTSVFARDVQTIMGFFPAHLYRSDIGAQFINSAIQKPRPARLFSVTVCDWQQEPHTQGGYPFPAPGEITTWGPILSRPYKRIFFRRRLY